MARLRLEPHPVNVTWAASGTISLELSPKPYTITRIVVVAKPSVTTTSATWYNDPWDRIISTLSLTGAGKTFFNFTNLRAAYHLSRLAGFGPPRPTLVADSQTTLLNQFLYVFHFGVAPTKANPLTGKLEDNPWDLTAGIPPVSTGNLTLGGSFAANSAMGSSVTTADCGLNVYLYGVQPEMGDAPAAYLPRAYPVWSQSTPTPTATSSAFATSYNVPAGNFLHSALVMLTNGSNAPRDDSVLNSFEVYNQLDSRSIFKFGGQTGVVADYKAAELISQFSRRQANNVYPNDNVSTAMTAILSGGTTVVPTIGQGVDSGLVWVPFNDFANKANPLYGVDLRTVATGDLKFNYGVSDATGVTLDVVHRRYELNMDHPANAGG